MHRVLAIINLFIFRIFCFRRNNISIRTVSCAVLTTILNSKNSYDGLQPHNIILQWACQCVYIRSTSLLDFNKTDVCNWVRDRVWETITTDLLPPFRNNIIKYIIILYCTTIKRCRRYFILLSNKYLIQIRKRRTTIILYYCYAFNDRYQIVWTLNQTTLIGRLCSSVALTAKKRSVNETIIKKILSWKVRCCWPNSVQKIRLLIK